MTTGEKIKQTRIAQNMTMEEFAEKIGTTKQNIYKYENGIVTIIRWWFLKSSFVSLFIACKYLHSTKL